MRNIFKAYKGRSLKGFTLAEVLVTFAVIGVVISLTIPPLVRDFQEKQHKAAFKKIYSDFYQAHKKLVFDLGGEGAFASLMTTKNNWGFRNLYKDYFNFIIVDNSWHEDGELFFFNGEKDSIIPGSIADVTLNNRMLITFASYGGCADKWELDNVCGSIVVDVNGHKGPNTWAKDVFIFYVSPIDLQVRTNTADCNRDTPGPAGYGRNCTIKVLKNEDY